MRNLKVPAVLLFTVVVVSLRGFSQPLHTRDFPSWTRFVSDSSSRLSYGKLLTRFLGDDSTMTDEDLVLLMHGYTLQPHYSPLGQSMSEDSLYQLLQAKEYQAAFDRGTAYLRGNPVSLRGTIALVLASKYLDRGEDSWKYQQRLLQLTRAIVATGTGESCDSAYAVISTNDEYAILSYFGYASSSQTLLDGDNGRSYDKLVAVSRDDPQNKRTFYFDVTRSMDLLTRELFHK